MITTVGNAQKAQIVRSFGADIVVDYHKEDILDVLKANPPSVALDCVGGKTMGACLETMAFGGRWIMIATLAGGETSLDLETLWRKRIRLIGSTLRSRTPEEKTEILQSLKRDLWPLFSARKLISHIHATFPVRDVAAAHAVLKRNENIGKVVLTFEDEK